MENYSSLFTGVNDNGSAYFPTCLQENGNPCDATEFDFIASCVNLEMTIKPF